MKYIRHILLMFILLLGKSFLMAQPPEFIEMKSAADYPFLLYVPKDYAPFSKPPVIIFLHGRSLSGTNLNLVKKYGVLDALERGRKIPAIVAAPQVKVSETWEPAKILSVLDYVEKHYDVDSSRIYVTGMSLGGYGTMYFTGKYPERVTAAVALCGGGKVADACNLSHTNLWIQHGKRDGAVAYTESTKIYDAVKACNPDASCFLTLYPSADHGELVHEFYKDTLYNWLFRFKKDRISTDTTHQVVIRTESRNTGKLSAKPPAEPVLKPQNTVTTPSVHYIKRGDTLYSLARKYHTTVKKLCSLNGIKEDSILSIGQKIKLP